jgi:hypothetical protein
MTIVGLKQGNYTTIPRTHICFWNSRYKSLVVGKLLASLRRQDSLAVHANHADNVLRGLSAAADDVEAASCSVGMPSHARAFLTRAMGR